MKQNKKFLVFVHFIILIKGDSILKNTIKNLVKVITNFTPYEKQIIGKKLLSVLCNILLLAYCIFQFYQFGNSFPEILLCVSMIQRIIELIQEIKKEVLEIIEIFKRKQGEL
ncbi:hypothetical protein HMPREF1150_1652 [Streptococcus sp. AS14]|uniref:hypothetical protein n=1 Tax=Streptococcus sp. AS14 TaxID=936577 RepID=UPI0002780A40|nr:hypothetical protein [Streptococcus sp. AS14]EJO18933.1 hypothetical protein HMPREF1150_1652 [Streptococcus sp. AS14]